MLKCSKNKILEKFSLSHTRIMKWFFYRSIAIVHLNLGYFTWFHIKQCTVMIILVSFSFCCGTCCRSTRQTFIDCAVLFVESAIARVLLLSVSSFPPFASTAATNKSKKEEKPHRWYVLLLIFWIWVAAERWCGKCRWSISKADSLYFCVKWCTACLFWNESAKRSKWITTGWCFLCFRVNKMTLLYNQLQQFSMHFTMAHIWSSMTNKKHLSDQQHCHHMQKMCFEMRYCWEMFTYWYLMSVTSAYTWRHAFKLVLIELI